MPESKQIGLGNLIGGAMSFLKDPETFAKKVSEMAQEKGMAFVEAFKQKLAEKLERVDKVEPLKPVTMAQGSNRTYLSRAMANTLRERLGEYKDEINKIPKGALSPYRDQSCQLIDDLVEELKRYEECFNVFMFGKKSGWFRRGVTIKELLDSRKQMKTYLTNMQKLLMAFNENDQYKYQNVYEQLKEGMDEKQVKAEITMARRMFKEAFMSVHNNMVYSRPVTQKDPNDRLKNITVRGIATYKDTAEMIRAVEAVGNTKLAEKLKEDLKWVEGLTPRELIGVFEGNTDDDFMRNYSNTIGGKKCYQEVERVLREKYNGDPFKFVKLSAEGPFMGDITAELVKCVDYTLAQLNTVINLGAKKSVIYGQDFQPSQLGINLKELIGSNYSEQREQWEAQTKTLDTTLTRTLGRDVERLHSQVEKEYTKIKAYQKKFFPEVRLYPPPKSDYYNFSQLIVPLSSIGDRQEEGVVQRFQDKEGNWQKGYNIETNYGESYLKKYYKDAQHFKGEAEQRQYDALYVRKANQFLEACKKWNEERADYESELKTRESTAAYWLKEVKKHYNELCAEGKKINRDQKQAGQPQNKDWKKLLDKAYKKFPYLHHNFMKRFDEYKKMAEAFCSMWLKHDGSGLTKYWGADETQPSSLLNDPLDIDSYFQLIKNFPSMIAQIRRDATEAKQHPWRQPEPAAGGGEGGGQPQH